MCGIVGYVGRRDAVPLLIEGLRRLEYRGYDSAGIALQETATLRIFRAPGRLAALEAKLPPAAPQAHCGIGHTRWATHGAPTEANAHPHTDATAGIAVVHNGIIENHRALKQQLLREGVVFRSETDTEVLPHLLRAAYRGSLLEAVRAVLPRLHGAYAFVALSADEPGLLVAARRGAPLVIGLGEGEHWIASDGTALAGKARALVYLEEGDCCAVRADGFELFTPAGECVVRAESAAVAQAEEVGLDGFPHFMLKEIHQQPEVIAQLLRVYLREEGIFFPHAENLSACFASCRRIVAVACGTAWHAALVGKYLIEQAARVPVEVEVASEFRYREPILGPETLVIAVSQSGETADTLEAVRLARGAGAPVLAVVNAANSSMARAADGILHLHAGPEIGVASTKAYTAQIAALFLLGVRLGCLRGTMGAAESNRLVSELRVIPEKLRACVQQAPAIAAIARRPEYAHARNAMFIGRGINYPSALEGALKLKEISYIHVEGYAAGEMKHGPIALVTDGLPVVCVAVQGAVYEKVLSNIQEIRARQGRVLAIATEGDAVIADHADAVISVPACPEPLSPLLVAVPLQLFAYQVAVTLGRDVDKPRNLAKSVTVE
jgi:glucosamine--fructose-6-phosphate aminotransferase (isomerizing)